MKTVKRGRCRWHKSRYELPLVGELESLTGKWSPCCKRCWNKHLKIRKHGYETGGNVTAMLLDSVVSNLGMKSYD